MPSNYCKSLPRSKSEMTHIGSTTSSFHPSASAKATINLPPPLSPQQQPQLNSDIRRPSTHSNINPSSSIPSTYRSHPTTSNTQPEALSEFDEEFATSVPGPSRPTHLALLATEEPTLISQTKASSRFRPTEPMTCPTEEPSVRFPSKHTYKYVSLLR